MKQCAACPWKKSTNPDRDYGKAYCKVEHRNLRSTIAIEGIVNLNQPLMACHKSPIGRETICVGWAYNQLTVGNNIVLRWRAYYDKRLQNLELVGPQHETFEDTLG